MKVISLNGRWEMSCGEDRWETEIPGTVLSTLLAAGSSREKPS